MSYRKWFKISFVIGAGFYAGKNSLIFIKRVSNEVLRLYLKNKTKELKDNQVEVVPC